MSQKTALINLDVISAKGFSQKCEFLQLHILFRSQLLRSAPVAWDEDDPIFNSSFSLKNASASEDDPTILIYVSSAGSPTEEQMPVKLLATALVDYRVADAYPSDFISVELLPCVDGDGIGDGIGAGGGLLFLKVSRQDGMVYGGADEANAVIVKRQEDLLRCQREFIQSTRGWWISAQKKYPFLQERYVKLLAKDECGHFRFVGSFISPMQSPRSLINPRFAARFVSLLPLKKDLNMTGIAEEAWHCSHAFLSRMEGNIEDHSVLLCSLLLGWGLDAFVATGTIYSAPKAVGAGVGAKTQGAGKPMVSIRPHVWVVTIDRIDERSIKVTNWESLTGSQFELSYSGPAGSAELENMPAHHFNEIHTLFRHDQFFFNIQSTANLPNPRRTLTEHHLTSFDLTNTKHWLPLPLTSRHDLKLLRHPGSLMLLPDVSFEKNISGMESVLEFELKHRIMDWRRECGLGTAFDGNLEQIVHSALVAYEWDRSVGVTFGNVDFQAAIRRYVRKGEFFKGYPTCFSHRDPLKIMQSLRGSTACKDVCLVSAGECRLAVRIKIIAYPAETYSVWVMIAVCAEKSEDALSR